MFTLALVAASASSQPVPADGELEQISRTIALESVKFGWLRWSSKKFPLRVAFASGENLKASGCADQWRQRYEEYVQFINTKQKLLVSTPITNPLDVFTFFGSVSELHALPAYRLQQEWTSRPGILILAQNLDRHDRSYSAAFGAADFIEFSASFQERTGSLLRCDGYDSVRDLSSALLPSYTAITSAEAGRRFGDNALSTLEWRAHRRLLSAMTRLPERELSAQAFKSYLREALSNE